MINKIINTAAEAVSEIHDGATVMIGGFGEAGSPIELIHALIDQRERKEIREERKESACSNWK